MSRIGDWFGGFRSRVTGIQTPIGGLSWKPKPDDGLERADDANEKPDELAEDDEELLEQLVGPEHHEVLVAIAESEDGWLDLEGLLELIDEPQNSLHHYLDVLITLALVEREMAGYQLTEYGRSYVHHEQLVR